MIGRVLRNSRLSVVPSFGMAKAEKSVIESVAGHKAPLNEETIHGRYTGVLFSAASEKKALGKVLEDMTKIKELMD